MEVDVIVVGSGNAGLSAAHAASRRGRRVVVLEKGGADAVGGNSYFTAGAFRFAHGGGADLAGLVSFDPRNAGATVPEYTTAMFAADMVKVTRGRNDPHLTDVLVNESRSTIEWLHELGVGFRLMYERQAYENPDGGHTFWGGLHVGSAEGGTGLIEQHLAIAADEGVDIRYGCAATDLILDDDRVVGVAYRHGGEIIHLRAESVILAAGGFEASAEMRRRYLGEPWAHAKVRGTPLNTGEMLEAAVRAGAARHGDWGSCHSVAWDSQFPHNESNRELTNQLTRSGYPLGIVVNRDAQRFLDEGADFRNYTYARYGAEILAQPGNEAFQVFDSANRPMLRAEEYDMPGASEISAASVVELARKMSVDPSTLVDTVEEFNRSITIDVPYDPSVKDGRAAQTTPPKSNWATAIDQPPLFAFPVTCGITFTFGGIATDGDGRARGADGSTIDGLFICGEMLGGLFSGNYPGGSGLTSGAVFGRRAGERA